MSYKRKYSFTKKFSFIFFLLMLFQMFTPSVAYALTSGPSQPEVQSFEPFGTSEMVDLFSGDFTYNIPLFELPGPNGGYPFNLAYHSGVGMDQEATWVGLGWSLNPGAINRNMRGIPDDFDGDEIKNTLSMKDHITYGVSAGAALGIADFPLSFNASLKVYYNTYKGMGFTIDQGIRLTASSSDDAASAGIGLNLSLDSQEGATITPSLSVSVSSSGKNASGSLGLGASMSYNSNRGLGDLNLSMNVSVSVRASEQTKGKDTKDDSSDDEYKDSNSTAASISAGKSISFSNSTYSPTIGNPMTGVNIVMSGHFGISFASVDPSFSGSGFFKSRMIKDNVTVNKSYGYLNLSNATDDAILDFNREKDAAVMLQTPNLAMTSLTYDVYSVQGQGVGGTYRPYRNDLGIVYDQKVESDFDDGSIGAEGNISTPPSTPGASLHFAINAENTHSSLKTLKWEKDNAMTSKYDFIKTSETVNTDFEEVFWKQPGEPVSEEISRMVNTVGEEQALRIGLNGFSAQGKYIDSENNEVNIWDNAKRKTSLKRKPRNIGILPLKNSDLIKTNTTSYLSEFNNIKYYNSLGNLIDFDRSEKADKRFRSNHIGGITAINTSGSRYVYGLPVYNIKNVTVTYALNNTSSSSATCGSHIEDIQSGLGTLPHTSDISGSDEYYSKKELPPYAYTYLLTAIVGPDYVDITNNGLSDDDFGYWVKFTYQKAQDNYDWRAPYTGANYMEGHKSIPEDDKGSYLYGTKEIYYLATAETKSHIAVFKTSSRADALSAFGEKANQGQIGSKTNNKLDKVSLYVKADYKNNPTEATVIKSIDFNYNYELCKQVENNNGNGTNNEGGKLTLKTLKFKNGTSNRGELNPYEFTYSSINPDYEPYAIDRWGNYKPLNPSDPCSNLDFPYVDQTNKTQANDNVSAWNLEKISLPSGGEINVEYEADDYAYVQNVQATNMFQVMKIGEGEVSSDNLHIRNSTTTTPVIVAGQVDYSALAENDRIYFKLKEPINPTEPTEIIEKKLEKYIAGLNEIYFKSKIQLRHEPGEYEEFVSGYLDLKNIKLAPTNIHDLNGNNKQEWAYVTFKYNHKVHPFSHAALLKLRNQFDSRYSKPISVPGIMNIGDNPIKGVKTVMGMVTDIVDLFTDYNITRIALGFSQNADPNKTWIKLNTPDKTKIGGGSRVKKITINDRWAESNAVSENSEYGQIYDYSTTEGTNEELISSGVATYEPIQGGDENALKSEKGFEQNLAGRENLLEKIEYPINESYYPGASVGYSKVTVRSLNTDNILKFAEDGSGSSSGIGFSSTGVTINEFYTAKDFPIISHETKLSTSKQNDPNYNSTTKKIQHINESLTPLPFGNVTDNLIASQGYSLILNNMHGKQKKVSNYALDKNGFREKDAYSSVTYEYSTSKPQIDANGNTYYTLNNIVDVLLSDLDPADYSKAEISKRRVATDYEMFNDMRFSSTYTETGGVTVKTEMYFGPAPILFVPYIPLIIPLPTVMFSKSEVKLATTNKIIDKSGILIKTIAYNDGVTLTTENKLFDAVTGKPLLTTVQNDYEKPIYSYTIPAHWKYPELGSAYENLGLVAEGSYVSGVFQPSNTTVIKNFIPGDECLAFSSTGVINKIVVTKVNFSTNEIFLEKEFDTNMDITKLMIVRSGKRNQLEADVSNIVALADPTKNRDNYSCEHHFDGSVISNNPEIICGFYEPIRKTSWELVNQSNCASFSNELCNLQGIIPKILGESFNIPYNYTNYISLSSGSSLPNYNFGTDVLLNCDNIRINQNSIDFYKNGAFFTSLVFVDNLGLLIDIDNIRNIPYNAGSGIPPMTPPGYIATNKKYTFTTVSQTLPDSYSSTTINWNFNSYNDANTIVTTNNFTTLANSLGTNNNTWNVDNPNLDEHFTTGCLGTSVLDYWFEIYQVEQHFELAKYERLPCQTTPSTQFDTYLFFTNDSCLTCTFELINDDCIPVDSIIPPADFVDHYYGIDSVLQISASTFSDEWLRNFDKMKGENVNKSYIEDLKDKTSFRNGQRGIWRNKESYAYLANRKGIDPNNEFDEVQSGAQLSSDGIFYANMFVWGGTPWANDCSPNWVNTNVITDYNSYGFEVENKDVLNNYSSALYGYNGSLPIAVSANAKLEELAFESFEELPLSQSAFTQYRSSEGNFDVYRIYESPQDPIKTINVKNYNPSFFNRIKIIDSTDFLPCENFPIDAELEITKIGIVTSGINRVPHAGLKNQLLNEWHSLNWNPGPSNLWLQTHNTLYDYNIYPTISNFLDDRLEYITNNMCTTTGDIDLNMPQLYPKYTDWLGITWYRVNYPANLSQPYSSYVDELNINTTSLHYSNVYDNPSIDIPILVTDIVNVNTTGPHIEDDIVLGKYSVINSTSLANYLTGITNLNFDDCEYNITSDINDGFYWEGKLNISLAFDNTPKDSYDFINISKTKAHTGKQSLKVDYYTPIYPSNPEATDFKQKRLFLESNQTYSFSAWVSRANENVTNYENIKIEILQYDNCDFTHISSAKVSATPTGPIINGWQKIEFNFTMNQNSNEIGVQFINSLNDPLNPAYFDDIRIHPIDATMQSYVYNTDNYKLEATLDNNNYATLNYYDEAGNLFLVKKETARGIRTIQESRSFLKPKQP